MHPLRIAAIRYFYEENHDSVQAVADRTDGVSHYQIYDLIGGRIQNPSHLAVPLFNATQYLPFAQALLSGTYPALRAVQEFVPGDTDPETVERELLDVHDSLSDLRKVIDVAQDPAGAGGVQITKEERATILRAIQECKHELLEMEAAVQARISHD